VAAIVLVAVLGALEASAHAAGTPIAQVPAATPLSGGEGWLVWSAPVPGGYALMGYHDGRVERLPVPLRSQPFDAAVGTSASRGPVVTFSRCTRVPRLVPVGAGDGSGGELVEPETAVGCRIRVLDLTSEREEAPPIPLPRGASDTSPSMYNGTVAFARHAPAHGDVWQVMRWSPGRPRRVVTLPHGRVPTCPELPHGCKRPAHATIAALSSDGAIVTFLWELPFGAEGIVGEGAWELRVDRVDGSASALAAGGFGHEACTAPTMGSHELEYIWPEPPIADAREALFPELYAFSCFQGFASVLGSHGAAPGRGGLGKLEAVALAVTRDEGSLYGIVPPPAESDNPSCSSAKPCAVERLQAPAMRREPNAPFAPFQ
jgi:hypothetical protein